MGVRVGEGLRGIGVEMGGGRDVGEMGGERGRRERKFLKPIQ